MTWIYISFISITGPSKRTLAGILCWFFETSGYLCAVSFAYLVSDNWRILQTLYSAPAILFMVYWWIAPESIRWLVTKGKYGIIFEDTVLISFFICVFPGRVQEARSLIHKAAKRNGVLVEERVEY